ncbi:RICIN domain-containing protein [Sphaerisporangium sp. NPDC088356]|uniref:RICIN domain-containing protein n=1 Tax=Sphaerisporangium sp. NPDC088356 TaxID=3154871 RepID=UPI00341F9E1E
MVSSRPLRVASQSTAPGAFVLQRRCASVSNQLWGEIDLRNGYYRIAVKHTGLCLEVNQAGGTEGKGNNARLLQWHCHGLEQQQWEKAFIGGGYFHYVNRRSGKCIEVNQSGSTKGLGNGLAIIQQTCNGSVFQQWRLRTPK